MRLWNPVFFCILLYWYILITLVFHLWPNSWRNPKSEFVEECQDEEYEAVSSCFVTFIHNYREEGFRGFSRRGQFKKLLENLFSIVSSILNKETIPIRLSTDILAILPMKRAQTIYLKENFLHYFLRVPKLGRRLFLWVSLYLNLPWGRIAKGCRLKGWYI